MSVLTSLVRPHLREFKNRELNPPKLLPSGAVPEIKLNQNENYKTRDWEYAAYPEYQHPKLLEALSRAYDVPQEWMKITHGADAGIHCLNELFCEPGSRIMVHTPTFFAYETYARKFQASAEDSPLIHANDEYSLGTQEILHKIKTSSNGLKAIYLCNPNNPTGTYFPEDEVLDIIEEARKKGIAVIIDEAYIEISGKPSMTRHFGETPSNMVVLRTMSKAYSAAMSRIATIISNDQEFLDIVQHNAQPIYPTPEPIADAALEMLDPKMDKPVADSHAEIRKNRDALRQALLETTGLRIPESHGNFLLLGVDDAQKAFDAFVANDILPGNFKLFDDFNNKIRITVGLPEQNQCVLETMRSYQPRVA